MFQVLALRRNESDQFRVICHDEGLWLETSTLESFYGVQIISSTQLIRPNVRKKSSHVGGFLYIYVRKITSLLMCTLKMSLLYFSCVKGKLVEVNERLLSNPDLLLQKVWYFNFSIFWWFSSFLLNLLQLCFIFFLCAARNWRLPCSCSSKTHWEYPGWTSNKRGIWETPKRKRNT